MNQNNRRTFLITLGASGLAMASGCNANRLPTSDLRILFYTDAHARPDLRAPHFLSSAAKIICDAQADFILSGGDNIHQGYISTEAATSTLFDIYLESFLKPLGRPVEHMIGNHDLAAIKPSDGSPPSPNPERIFKEKLGIATLHKSHLIKGHKIILLNSVEPTPNGERAYRGHVSAEQIAWLKTELASTPTSTPIILCSHIPLQTSFHTATMELHEPIPSSLYVTNNLEIFDLFSNHNLALILQGHLHINEWIQWNRTHILMGGAICGKWWQGANRGTHPGYGIIGLREGRLSWIYNDYGWSEST